MIEGVCLGVAGAFLQSVAYVFSKLCLIKTKMTALRFLMISHFLIALVASLAWLLFCEKNMPAKGYWFIYLLGGSTSYFLGQLCLIQALNSSEASRVSALLGMKIPLLAIMSLVYQDSQYRFLHWLAIGLILLSALYISSSGKRMSKEAIVWAVLACVGYSIADIAATQLINCFSYGDKVNATIMSVSFTYMICGAICGMYFLFKLASRLYYQFHHNYYGKDV